MKFYKKQSIITFTSSVLLTSCATLEPSSELGSDIEYNGSDCISIRTIRDYTPLDRRSLIIKSAGTRNYYVTLVASSFELRSSHQLGFSSRDNWLCPYGGDAIVVGAFDDRRASIRRISRLTAEQVDDLLIRYGKKEPEEQPDQAPAELDSAKVEELGEIG